VLAAWALGASVGCGWKLQTREVPAVESGGEAGEAGEDDALAPEFSLPSDLGGHVSLGELLADGKPAVLVFYRGHW
jgi:hypothetical protein